MKATQQFNIMRFAKKVMKTFNYQIKLQSIYQFSVQYKYTAYQDIANWLRIDSINAIHVTKSGHPSSCASIAEIISVLFFHNAGMKFYYNSPNNFINDRIVLSKGHAAPILYSALYRSKIITYEQLMSLRLKNSIFEGHPTPKVPFVDVATGSLGQGLSVAAGMAYSSKYYDKIKNRIFCITGDGETAQGNIWEAADFASNYNLNNLTLFVDVNKFGQSVPSIHNQNINAYQRKFNAFGWATSVINGHQISQIVNALQKARNQNKKPTAIICKTIKGKNLTQDIQNKLDWHGKDVGNKIQKVNIFIKNLIGDENIRFITNPPQQKIGQAQILQKGIVKIKPNYQQNAKISTRRAYGNGLKKARQSNSNVIGLDADTKNSTFSITLKQKYPESFIQCFIAQQNMVGVAIGLSCRNKIPFCSSFGAFLMRAVDQIRIAGIGGNSIKIVGSHSGCSIGQDGPSQMALQDLGIFRNIPNGLILVPSDAVSTQKAVQLTANYNLGPSYIRTSRPDVPILYCNDQNFQIGKSKLIKSSENDQLLLVSYGVTLHQCLKAYNNLLNKNIKIRVIDLFCLKPLDSKTIISHIKACNRNILVVEQHYEAGGAYEAICGAAASYIKRIQHLCVRKIPGSASPSQQLQLQGINSQSIQKYVHQIISH